MITLVSGISGAGKSTVSRLLAAARPRAVHLESDRVGEEFVVSGLVLPGGDPADEAETQLALRRRHLMLLADSFAGAGFDVMIDDVVLWPALLQQYCDALGGHGLRFVVLAPSIDVVAARDAGRGKQVFDRWRHLQDEIDGWADRPGMTVDSTRQPAQDTVDEIIDRADAALLG